jgi:hypothetical protein
MILLASLDQSSPSYASGLESSTEEAAEMRSNGLVLSVLRVDFDSSNSLFEKHSICLR